ncbi:MULTISPECIES: aldehyde dehydrogenase family protein [unclassified Bradyrhizobium]|uniref:aldehyde dehydrogenase family protein n=1 Tax=unclassified Bradyrhizobium TaxID=2631580 RepID=UPI002FEFC5A5
MRPVDAHWIDGGWHRGTSSRMLPVIDPSTEQILTEVSCASPAEVDAAVSSARRALAVWRGSSLENRAALLLHIAQRLEARTELFAETLAREIGSPLWFGRQFQVPMPIRNLAAMVEALQAIAFEENAASSVVWREPVGVIAAITPWNAPLHQIIAKVGAAIAAGCTVIVKPSELAPSTARALVEVLDEVGVPAGVVNVVFGDGETGRALVEHPEIDLVSFTGSVRAGRKVAALAGEHIKQVKLELGGKSAAVILDDADLEAAVAGVLRSCFSNSGQVCVAQTRLIVPMEARTEIEALCQSLGADWVMGHPLAPETRIGPLASGAGRDRVRRMITEALSQGARAIIGGPGAPEGLTRGYYMYPTVLTDLTAGMEVVREEAFGPVLSLLHYSSLDEAVELANATRFGLSGGIWTSNRERGVEVARRLRTGQVSINGAPQNYATPFGGCGWSGFGRENGRYGIESFLQYKAVHGVQTPPGLPL